MLEHGQVNSKTASMATVNTEGKSQHLRFANAVLRIPDSEGVSKMALSDGCGIKAWRNATW